MLAGPNVEFFNPKLRSELEKKDAEIIKKTGMKGAAPGGDTWVWLTSYSRIPVSKHEAPKIKNIFIESISCVTQKDYYQLHNSFLFYANSSNLTLGICFWALLYEPRE